MRGFSFLLLRYTGDHTNTNYIIYRIWGEQYIFLNRNFCDGPKAKLGCQQLKNKEQNKQTKKALL